jgi:hypothetical protein
MHKMYVQEAPPTEEQVLKDAEDDGLQAIEIVSVTQYQKEHVN